MSFAPMNGSRNATGAASNPFTSSIQVAGARVDFGPEVNGARPVRVFGPGQQSVFTLRDGSSSAQNNGTLSIEARGRQLRVNGVEVPFDGSAPRAASPAASRDSAPPMAPLPPMQPMQPMQPMRPLTMSLGGMTMSMGPGGMTASLGTPETTMHLDGRGPGRTE